MVVDTTHVKATFSTRGAVLFHAGSYLRTQRPADRHHPAQPARLASKPAACPCRPTPPSPRGPGGATSPSTEVGSSATRPVRSHSSSKTPTVSRSRRHSTSSLTPSRICFASPSTPRSPARRSSRPSRRRAHRRSRTRGQADEHVRVLELPAPAGDRVEGARCPCIAFANVGTSPVYEEQFDYASGRPVFYGALCRLAA